MRRNHKHHGEHKEGHAPAEDVPPVPALHVFGISCCIDRGARGNGADQKEEECSEPVDEERDFYAGECLPGRDGKRSPRNEDIKAEYGEEHGGCGSAGKGEDPDAAPVTAGSCKGDDQPENEEREDKEEYQFNHGRITPCRRPALPGMNYPVTARRLMISPSCVLHPLHTLLPYRQLFFSAAAADGSRFIGQTSIPWRLPMTNPNRSRMVLGSAGSGIG